MKCSFEVIGTGSSGNCYLLRADSQVLVIEAGVNFTKVKKALSYDLSGVVGVLVSHEHGDHADFVKDFQKFGKNIWTSKGTYDAFKMKKGYYLSYLEKYGIGNFVVTPFEVFHDAKEPCGFLIEFNGKRLAFITDTCDLKTRLKNIDYWVIEANYSNDKLQASSLDVSLKKRIQQTHMSIDRCKTILEAHNAQNSELVLLIHGSEKHACNEEFLNKIPYASIAENGLIIDL
jgi:phosphoribosyl 1,2-cyclic phosphodiesterase